MFELSLELLAYGDAISDMVTLCDCHRIRQTSLLFAKSCACCLLHEYAVSLFGYRMPSRRLCYQSWLCCSLTHRQWKLPRIWLACT